MINAVVHALSVAFGMTWEILWPLILGFTLSGIVQAVVSKREMTQLLPDDSTRSLAVACGLGAASSSCSYAAVALARSLVRRGANFTAAMAFEIATGHHGGLRPGGQGTRRIHGRPRRHGHEHQLRRRVHQGPGEQLRLRRAGR